uniref:HIT-type domain-containing protein n=1 Tax=Leptobrachium leishanense TaxID=445787 RepID=A0A8C5WLN3_9ANUR
MAARSPVLLVPTRGVSPAGEESVDDGYTCPRCNMPYCSLACYRGPGTRPAPRTSTESPCCESCGRRRRLGRTGGRPGGHPPSMCGGGSPVESHSEIGALLPEWTPWWATAKRTKKTNCVIMELPPEGKSDKNHENCHLQEENYPQAPECGSGLPFAVAKFNPESHSGIPPGRLTSLCRSPSPMVRFSVVNALYGYAFSLQRHHGDLSDEDILLDFIGTLLYISGGLGSTIIYNFASHALQSAIRAASDPMSGGDQVGACSAMEATSQILEGDGSNTYSLAALTHTSRILEKAQKLLSEDKQTRRRVFNAKKKCLFPAAWVNDNSECLPTLSKAVKQEHEQHLQYINGLTKITTGLQKRGTVEPLPPKK